MESYPVAFRCAGCNEEKPSYDALECHIWAQHLRTFPFRCALCGFPALTATAIAAHSAEYHDSAPRVEFKRKLDDEIKLKRLISQSIVVPVIEQEEVFGDDAGQQVDHVDSHHHQQQLIRQMDEGPVASHDDPLGQESVVAEEIIGENEVLDDSMVPVDEAGGYEVAYEQLVPIVDENGQEHTVQYVDQHGHPVVMAPYHTMTEGMAVMTRRAAARLARSRHIETVVRRVAAKPRRRAPTIHQCEECGKILKYPSKIAEHKRSHTGERPHMCPQCGLSFSQKGALKCHVRLHTGERPYECTWECGRSFVSSSARQMHEKTHTGEKPFACGVCGQLFSKKFHMLRHQRNQHDGGDELLGLDMAGPDAEELTSTVEEVIEGVRKTRLKRVGMMRRMQQQTDLQQQQSY